MRKSPVDRALKEFLRSISVAMTALTASVIALFILYSLTQAPILLDLMVAFGAALICSTFWFLCGAAEYGSTKNKEAESRS